MDCMWVRKQLSRYLARELRVNQRLTVARHLQGCAACRAEEERTLQLEQGLRQALRAVAEREALRPQERTAILSRLMVEMNRWQRTGRVLRPAWSWLGMAIAFLPLLFSLVSPLLGAPASVPIAEAMPAARAVTCFEALQLASPTVSFSTIPAQPTAWPAMDLTLSQARETTYPKGTKDPKGF